MIEIGVVNEPSAGFTAPNAKRLEDMGFDYLLTPDTQNLSADPYGQLSLAAAATKTIKLGTGVTNPITRDVAVTASALATLQIFDDDDVIKRNQQRAEKLAQALQPIAAHPQVSHVRQRGMIAAFDVSPTTREGFARRFFTTALQKELLLRPIGTTVYWMPPFVLSDEEMALLGERTLEVLQLTTH